jgi:arylsulfatase A-like enzyme
VHTPTLENLAREGLRYNRFHVTSVCSATRAALLTGRNDHRSGFGTVTEVARGYPGYDGIWKKDVASVAEVLRRNGYSTAAFGKWHNTPYWEISPVGPFDRWPTGLGFESFYGFMGGVDDQWEPNLYRNTVAVDTPGEPGGGYHFTTDIATEAIRWIRTHESLAPSKPFFLYFATGATHVPHHVPREWIQKYRGRFDAGWNKLREQTFSRQKALGVIPQNALLTKWPKEIPAWDSFDAKHKAVFARQMEVYAGCLEHTDHEIGRVLQAIQQGPGRENTLIMYIVGDNGGSSEGGPEGSEADVPIDERLARLDLLGSEFYRYNEYASGWGLATNAPFQWSKQVASHLGGIRVPLAVSWPSKIRDVGGVRDQFTHVTDVVATIYQAAGIQAPEVVDGVAQKSLDGVSFEYTFDQPTAPSRHRQQIFEQFGNRAMYKDGWIASARHSLPWEWGGSDDFEHDRWELYNLEEDFSQARDLAKRFPEKLAELRALFDALAKSNDIYPLGNLVNHNEQGWRDAFPALGGQREFALYPSLPRLNAHVAPNFAQTHKVVAELMIPEAGTEGVILASGDRFGGFAFYVQNNHLIYENNAGEERDIVTSTAVLPDGEVIVGYSLTLEGASAGVLRLYVNGALVREARLARITRNWWGGTLGVGRSYKTISINFRSPFAIGDALRKVQVTLGDDVISRSSSVHN